MLDAALIGADGRRRRRSAGSAPQGRHAAELAADALAPGARRGAPARAAELAAPPASGERVLVALSGGVDSRGRGAARARARGGGGRGDVEAVGRPAHRRERGAAARRWRCSAPARLAHALGIPHLTLDLEPQFRERGRRRLHRRLSRRADAEPVRASATASCGSTRCSRSPTGSAARRSRPVTTRGSSTTARARCSRPPPIRAKDQTYMLSGLAPGTLARLRFPLAELEQAARCASSPPPPGLPVAGKAESQDLCFLAGEGKRRSSPATAASASGRARSSTARGRHLGRHRGHHDFTVGQRRGLGLAAPEPLYVLATDADANTVVVGIARGARHATRSRVREATLHRPGGARRPGAAALSLAPARLRARAGGRRRASTPSSSSSSPSPPTASRPGQTACLMSRRGRRRPGDDRLMRLERADLDSAPDDAPTRSARRSCPSSSSGATCGCRRPRWCPPPTTPRPCSRSPGCSRSSPTSRAARSRRAPRLTSLPALLSDRRHRGGRQRPSAT